MGEINFKFGKFGFNRPDPKGPIKGVVVLSEGSNGDGRNLVHSKKWVDLALKKGFLLMGTFFQDHHPGPVEGYADASKGSGEMLLTELDNHLQKEGVDDPNEIPIYLWGFSAGGQFSYEFACWRPDRVGGFCANKGGVYYTALAPQATRETKGLIFLGTNDSYWRQAILRGIYELNKACGAQWQLIEEPCGHAIGKSEDTGIDFFDWLATRRQLQLDEVNGARP